MALVRKYLFKAEYSRAGAALAELSWLPIPIALAVLMPKRKITLEYASNDLSSK